MSEVVHRSDEKQSSKAVLSGVHVAVVDAISPETLCYTQDPSEWLMVSQWSTANLVAVLVRGLQVESFSAVGVRLAAQGF